MAMEKILANMLPPEALTTVSEDVGLPTGD
jgi:hypothetical protein